MKIEEALKYGIDELNKSQVQEANLKVRLLLSYVFNKEKEYLIIHGDEELDKNTEKKYLEGLEKLKSFIPIQYIINKQEFMGYDFFVDERVLIPQPDTEVLVEEVINIAKEKIDSQKNSINILDLCTGSGAIGISLSKILGESANVTCSDISEDAIEIVHNNSVRNFASIGMIQSDLFENIYGKYDIIVSNPPYIETEVIKTLSKEVQKEPQIALDGGKDGLDFYRRIISEAKNFLNDNGYLALEIGYNQKEKVIELFKMNKKLLLNIIILTFSYFAFNVLTSFHFKYL